MFSLSEPVIRESVVRLLEKHNSPLNDTLVNEIVQAVPDKNNATNKSFAFKGTLSTAKSRATYYEANFPFVRLVTRVPY